MELHVSEVKGEKRIFTGIVRDVTELKQAHERAMQAERLAAIGEMSAGLAHESRNALQRSQACLEMLRREIANQPSALDLVGRIQQAQNHLLQLYEETRAYAAPVVLNRERCDLRTIALKAWDHLQASRKHRQVKLQSEPGKVDSHAEVDPMQTEQVFRNIFENALQAAADSVEIEVLWPNAELDGRPALQLTVRNDGPALTPDQRRRLFEPFYTTRTHGTGLGMTIVKRIIEFHGGKIQIGPDSGRGVEFLITLPRSKP
jgi:hypothetical protein